MAGGGSSGGGGMINRVVGNRYEVLETIGEGAVLAAFRARDRELNRVVALKVLRAALADRADVQEQLRTGLSQVVSLSHAGIARILDAGTDPVNNAPIYITEEYVRGIDLKERIRRTAPFSLTAATDTAITLAEGLEFAHERGVHHGDVRPQNVVVGPEGQVKLTGFGVPSVYPLLLNDTSLLMRLAPYTAPEIADTRVPTASGDIYALGITLFEMLTGDLPYAGDGPIQIALRHAKDPVPSPRTLNSGVPRALEGIVMRAMGKVPAERYASVAQMLQDLRTVRDALRYGKSLSWSPMDHLPTAGIGGSTAAAASAVTGASAAGEAISLPPEDATVVSPMRSAASAASAEEAGTIVMPGVRQTPAYPASDPLAPPRVAVAPPPASAAAAYPYESEDALASAPARSGGNRWLFSLNLFLSVLIVGALATLAYLMVYFIKPPSEVVVPNLIGKQVAEAETIAAEGKFKLAKRDEQYREKEPAGMIYQMRPEPGRHIREGKPVEIWVSKGPQQVDVPDLRDMSFERARVLLGKSGLRLGEYRAEFDPLVSKGNVVRQMPEPGELRPRGTKIDLILSKGEEPPPPPIEVPMPDLGTDNAAVDTPSDNDRNSGDSGGNDDMDTRLRVFAIEYRVPNDNQPHRIRIDVTDRDGTRTVYDDPRDPGEKVKEDVEGIGRRVTIRLYDNDQMQREVTK